MANLQVQNNLVSFIYQNLVGRLKLQLDLPDIEDLHRLFGNSRELSIEQVEEIRKKVQRAEFLFPELKSEFLVLVDALVLHISLRADDITRDLIENCYVKLEYLKNRRDLDIASTLNSVESCIIHALNSTNDIHSLKIWLSTIKKLKDKFDYDDVSVKNWFEVKLIENLVSEIQKNETEYTIPLLLFINEMIKEGFALEDIKTIAIDSAFYQISDLEEKKMLGQISEILGTIKEIEVVESLKARFEIYEKKYGAKRFQGNEEEKSAEFITGKDEIVFGKLVYTREVQTRDDHYTITVNQGIISSTSETVAIKTYRSFNHEIIEKFKQEIEILKVLSTKAGPFMKYYGSYLSKNFREDYDCDECELGIVMEFCPNNLADEIKKMRTKKNEFSEEKLQSIVTTLLEGFIIMSESSPKIYHQDIKPDNIFFTQDGRVVIGDFNISTLEYVRNITQTTGMGAIQGTLNYMAPELATLITNGGKGKFRRSKADVYSFGVTIFHMYTREVNTYNDLNKRSVRQSKIEEIKYPWLKTMIILCLKEHYGDRPSFKDLIRYADGSATIAY